MKTIPWKNYLSNLLSNSYGASLVPVSAKTKVKKNVKKLKMHILSKNAKIRDVETIPLPLVTMQ